MEGSAFLLLARIESRGKNICPVCEKELNGTYCSHCQEDFFSKDDVFGGVEMVVCPECETRQAIGKHTKTHKGKRLVCEHCERVISINDATGEISIYILPM